MAAFLLFLLFPLALFADIDHVIVKWSPALCNQGCVQELNNRFSKLKGVETVSIDQANGIMQLKWKKNAPFSYTDLNWTMRYVGLYMTYVRIRATGRILKRGDIYQLKSEHDNTSFELIGTANASNPNLAVAVNSIYNRPIEPAVAKQLDTAIANKLQVTIDGTLFEPWRGPPTRIVVGQVRLIESKPKSR